MRFLNDSALLAPRRIDRSCFRIKKIVNHLLAINFLLFHGVEFYIKDERALPVSEKSTEELQTFFD